jgi:enoyl-CoA hydratase
MNSSGLIITSTEESVAVLQLNRPEKRNALSQDLIDELIKQLSLLDQDPTVRAVVLTGIGQKPFCGMLLRKGLELSTLISPCSWS